MATYICNAFSLQMLPSLTEVNNLVVTPEEKLPEGLESAIGHADTAHVLGYEANRVNVKLNHGECIYVAQLVGGRLPEGSTTLPEDFHFDFVKVELL